MRVFEQRAKGPPQVREDEKVRRKKGRNARRRVEVEGQGGARQN